MNTLTVVFFACLVVFATAKPSGILGLGGLGIGLVPAGPTTLIGASGVVGPNGAVGPSGIVTGNGAAGPVGVNPGIGHGVVVGGLGIGGLGIGGLHGGLGLGGW